MILDILENAHCYETLNKGFAKAITFLLRPDLKKLDAERHEIDGDRVYAIVAKDLGRKKEEALLETHNKYIDIQFVLSGTDNMGWKPKALCKQVSKEYDEENDIEFFTDKPDAFLSVKDGTFAIFFPEDAHMPMISSELLHKVIIKIAVD